MKKIKVNVVKTKQVKKKYFEVGCLVVSNTESFLYPKKD